MADPASSLLPAWAVLYPSRRMTAQIAPARAASAASPPPELTVVVPCYNERPNVAPLVDALAAALAGIAWEVLFVDDDSPDGTTEEARRLAGLPPRYEPPAPGEKVEDTIGAVLSDAGTQIVDAVGEGARGLRRLLRRIS